MFNYSGPVSSSKSLYNRGLILASYNRQIQIEGQTDSVDVRVLKKALEDFNEGQNSFYCADAGTAFRFLILRLSRAPGRWKVSGSERLLSRPQAPLREILSQLGVQVEQHQQEWIMETSGWTNQDHLHVPVDQSSQFLSSLLLNCWDLHQDLRLSWSGHLVSAGYFLMTQKLVQQFGLQFDLGEQSILLKAQQTPLPLSFQVEADMSSCFALAACAVQDGRIEISHFPWDSIQPDLYFIELLQQMGVAIDKSSSSLRLEKMKSLKAIEANLNNTPDLFPVLAVLLARAQGVSKISGLEHLAFKESHRIQNSLDLLRRLGRNCGYENGYFTIEGNEQSFHHSGNFDPDQDHRMAMAAQVANFYGAQLFITDKTVVNKSFPEFWQCIGRPS